MDAKFHPRGVPPGASGTQNPSVAGDLVAEHIGYIGEYLAAVEASVNGGCVGV